MKPIKVLIVDDSSVMRRIVKCSLRMAGVEMSSVMEANDGWEALALARGGRPDLVLCAIDLIGMGSLSFVGQFSALENCRGIPVVMITNECGPKRIDQALSSGAVGSVRIPFTPDQMRIQLTPFFDG